MLQLKDIKPGNTIVVREWSGDTVTGVVDSTDSDIKGGRPGVDYVQSNGDGRWCYLDQIVRVVK